MPEYESSIFHFKVSRLMHALTNRDLSPERRVAVADSLGDLVRKAVITGPLRRLHIAESLMALLTDQSDDPRVRAEAAFQLGVIGSSMPGDVLYRRVVDVLVATLNRPDDVLVRADAALALGWLGEFKEAVVVLAKALQDPGEPIDVRENAASALLEICWVQRDPVLRARVLPLVARVLKDMSTESGVAPRAGERLVPPRLQSRPYVVVHEPEPVPGDQRSDDQVIAEITRMRAARDIVGLLTVMSYSEDPAARVTAAEAFAWDIDMRRVDEGLHERVVESLIEAMMDEEVGVRERAAQALDNVFAALDSPALRARATQPLMATLQDEDEDQFVYEAAAAALETIGTPEALEAARRWYAQYEEEF